MIKGVPIRKDYVDCQHNHCRMHTFILSGFIYQINEHIPLKTIATWCLVTLRFHRCGFKTAEQDTKSTRPIMGLPKVIPSPGYLRPCLMSCITPRLAVLSGHAWCPFMGTSTVSCTLLMYIEYMNLSSFYLISLDTFSKTVFFVSLFRSPLLCADLSESPSPGHVAATTPSQPLTLRYDPFDPYSLDHNPWSPISDICRPDPVLGQESVWRKPGPVHLETANEMEDRQKTKTPSFWVFSSLRGHISHLRPVSQNDPEAFIISRKLLTI